MADGWHPSWKPATDAEILTMCERLILEPPTPALVADAMMMLQRCRLTIEIARNLAKTPANQAHADTEEK